MCTSLILRLTSRVLTVPEHCEQGFTSFDPTGTLLATSGANNTLSLWSVWNNSVPGQEFLQLQSSIEVPSINSMPSITGLDWSPDGKVLALTGNSLVLYVVRGQQLENFYKVDRTGKVNYDYKGCIFPDESTLFVFKRYHTTPKTSALVKYKVSAGKYVSQVKESTFFQGGHHTVYALDSSRTKLAFGTIRGDIIVVSCETLEVLYELKVHMYCVTGVTWVTQPTTGEEVIVSCGLDKRLVCIDSKGGNWNNRTFITLGLALVLIMAFLIFSIIV